MNLSWWTLGRFGFHFREIDVCIRETFSTAFLTHRFKLFSVKLEKTFKKYMNYSTLCFKFSLKLTKISTKYIKTERFQCSKISLPLFFLLIFHFIIYDKKMYPLPSGMIFIFHFKKINYNPISLYEIKHLVAFSTWKRTLSTEQILNTYTQWTLITYLLFRSWTYIYKNK